jgi:hypothetical protein
MLRDLVNNDLNRENWQFTFETVQTTLYIFQSVLQ